MRRLPVFTAALFVVITLVRVAWFSQGSMKTGPLGWFFSIGLGAGVFVSAYWNRVSVIRDGQETPQSADLRKTARRVFILFILADGFFNLVESFQAVNPQTLLLAISTLIYGAFPTIATGALSAVQTRVDRIPAPPGKYNVSLSFRKAIVALLDRTSSTYEVVSLPTEAEVKTLPPASPDDESGVKASAGSEAGVKTSSFASFREAQLQRMSEGWIKADEIASSYGVTKRTAFAWLAKVKAEVEDAD